MEDHVKKNPMYIDVYLGHFAVWQKSTEHCKSTIIKNEIKKLNMNKTQICHLWLLTLDIILLDCMTFTNVINASGACLSSQSMLVL